MHVHAWGRLHRRHQDQTVRHAELADAVADLIRVAPEPGRGDHRPQEPRAHDHRPEPEEIFERVGPHIQRQVPMS